MVKTTELLETELATLWEAHQKLQADNDLLRHNNSKLTDTVYNICKGTVTKSACKTSAIILRQEGFTIKYISDRLGVSTATINRWLSSYRNTKAL